MDEPTTSLSLIHISLKPAHSEEAQHVKALFVTMHCVGAAAIGTLSLWASRAQRYAWPGQGLRVLCGGIASHCPQGWGVPFTGHPTLHPFSSPRRPSCWVTVFFQGEGAPGEAPPSHPLPRGSEHLLGRMVLYRFFRTSPGMSYSFGSTKFMGISCGRTQRCERWGAGPHRRLTPGAAGPPTSCPGAGRSACVHSPFTK